MVHTAHMVHTGAMWKVEGPPFRYLEGALSTCASAQVARLVCARSEGGRAGQAGRSGEAGGTPEAYAGVVQRHGQQLLLLLGPSQ